MNSAQLKALTGAEVRFLCRRGQFSGPTAGVAHGYTQANLVILRRRMAGDFESFCRANPKPCPILAILPPGEFQPRTLARGADLRTDLPAYRVYRNGRLCGTVASIESECQDDFVSFLLGCSFTFDAALIRAGLPVRHVEQGCNVSMYRTNKPCKPAGAFSAPLVVSMRPMTLKQAEVAQRITDSLVGFHGGPIHIGDPAALGIADIAAPDYGDAVTIEPNETTVFWACGVTPMEAIAKAKPDIAITHEPGHMFVTDELNADSLRPTPAS